MCHLIWKLTVIVFKLFGHKLLSVFDESYILLPRKMCMHLELCTWFHRVLGGHPGAQTSKSKISFLDIDAVSSICFQNKYPGPSDISWMRTRGFNKWILNVEKKSFFIEMFITFSKIMSEILCFLPLVKSLYIHHFYCKASNLWDLAKS